jgi:hypothetical protein
MYQHRVWLNFLVLTSLTKYKDTCCINKNNLHSGAFALDLVAFSEDTLGGIAMDLQPTEQIRRSHKAR